MAKAELRILACYATGSKCFPGSTSLSSPALMCVWGGSDAADQEEQGKNTSDAAADAGVCGYQKRRLSRGTAANSTDASCAKDL